MAKDATVPSTEREKEEKKKQLTIKLHRAILNAKTAKVGSTTVMVHHIEGVQDETPYENWKDDGSHEYEAEAEFFFVPKDPNGVWGSSGRLDFRVTFMKEEDRFELLEPLHITNDISTMTLKTIENDKTSNNKENNHETENS